jgi:hypothetical protein
LIDEGRLITAIKDAQTKIATATVAFHRPDSYSQSVGQYQGLQMVLDLVERLLREQRE